MKQNLITDVIQGMLPYLNNAQTERLQEVLQYTLFDYEVTKIKKDEELSEQNLVESFLSAKRIDCLLYTSTGKVKKGFRAYCTMVIVGALALGMTTTAFAANDPLTVVNNLSDFIFGLIRAIGMILLGFGIVQVGLSLKSHDPSQRANGFLTLAGGVIITFAKEILTLITG